MIGPIAEVAGKVTEVAVEASKETAKEKGIEATKKSVDIAKRVEIGRNPIDNAKNSVDISKRITPEKIVSVLDAFSDLTVKQKKELIKNGMSPGIIEDCKYQDGIYKLKTRNEKLADSIHLDSGVKYVRKVVDIFGNMVEGVFPKFMSEFTTTLPDNMLKASDRDQFNYCISKLQEAIKNNPEIKKRFSPRQLEQIASGKTPSGFTWHHNEDVGKMELVDSKTHDAAKHTGGRALWGGGSINR